MVLRFVVDVHTTCFGSTNPTDNKESEKTKHAHMTMEIKENATKTNTN
jgi:hypothetical protein